MQMCMSIYTLFMFVQEMCKKKGLNHLLPNKTELYDEHFVLPKKTTEGGEGAETEQEKHDRLKRGRKNLRSWIKYVLSNVADSLVRALLLTADVPDTRGFNAHT